MREEAFDRGGILGRAGLEAQDVFRALHIHAHGAENVMVPKALPVDVDRQNRTSSQRRSCNCFSCSALASMAWRLMELRDTPTVAAIFGSTSWYSRVETPRSKAPSMCCPKPRSFCKAS
jgi:hypothetical protein